MSNSQGKGKLIMVVAAIVALIAVFMPFMTAMGESFSTMQAISFLSSNDVGGSRYAIYFAILIFPIIILILSLMGKGNIVCAILGVIDVILLGMLKSNFQSIMDLSSMFGGGVSIGMGFILCIIGNIGVIIGAVLNR